MPKHYKIHPAIGIARLGNSHEYFLGPEIPGTLARPSDNLYRDATKKLRRQAVRFWVFEHDDAQPDMAPRPVLAGEGAIARIEWTVHLANKKAIWFAFAGLTGEGPAGYPPGHPLRNAHIADPVQRRQRLIIDPGPRTLFDRDQEVEMAKGNSAGYPETWPGPLTGGKEITSLGTMVTDNTGRLIVAGGYGTSGTTGPLPPQGGLRFDNNDTWFDDTADGSVQARVAFTNGTTAEVKPAWVIVGPPDFAPPIENIVTMYDLLYDLALRFFGLDPSIFNTQSSHFVPEFRPSFLHDIYPILRRAMNYRWVHNPNPSGTPGFHSTLENLTALSAPPSGGVDPHLNRRRNVFRRLRNPNPGQPNNIPGNMPKLHGDQGEGSHFTLTITQYELMHRWAEGQFHNDGWTGSPPFPPTTVTAAGLDRAALEAAVGGAFFPGIEAGWIMRDQRIYDEAFRLRYAASESDPTGVTPGDFTKRSALPWQADFLKCGDNWWPAQRPNQVPPSPLARTSEDWAQGITSHVDLVNRWHLLGIVVPASDQSSPALFHESEREIPRGIA